MKTQSIERNKSRAELSQQRLRNRADSFLPRLESQRGFGLGYGCSSGYVDARNSVSGLSALFHCR